MKLLTPFDGDQALFLYFAQAIDHGEKLYVDVWDMKQPGVFWFYWLGGKIFGSSELGVKLLELGWFLAFALCLILCLRRTLFHLLAQGGKPSAIERYRNAVGRDYGWIREHLLAFRDPAGGEPIYVFGDPLVYLVTERRQAIPVNGWSWEAYPSEMWEVLPEMLAAARPAYLFVDNLDEELIGENSRPTRQFIDTDYVLVKAFDKGHLYARRSPPPDAVPDTGWHPQM